MSGPMHPMSSCPDPGELAAFIDGTLGAADRIRLEEHLAGCDACRELLASTVQLLRVPATVGSGQPAASRRWRGALAIGAGLAAAASVLLAVWLNPGWFGGGDPRLEALVAAVGTERTFEGRLSGGFAYGAVRTPTRSGTDTANLSLLAAAGELQQAAAADPSAANLHAWGVAQLLLADYDNALVNLRDAAALAPQDARLQNDYASALLTRAARTGTSGDIARALELAETATTLDPDLREAWFNRAVALEGLALISRAREAWEAYLAKDSDSQWADEARTRVAALDQQGRKTSDPDLLRILETHGLSGAVATPTAESVAQYLEDELMPAWGTRAAAGVSDAQTAAAIVALANQVGASQGDRMMPDAAARIAAAGARPLAPNLRQLGRAHVAFRDLKRAFNAVEVARIDALASECARLFRQEQSPLEFWCEFYLSGAAFYRGNQPLSRSRAETLLTRVPPTYPIVRARLSHHLGGLSFAAGDYQVAIDRSITAADMLARADATTLSTAARQTAASAYVAISEFDPAWEHYAAALAAVADGSQPVRAYTLLNGIGTAALRASLPHVARHMFQTAIEQADAIGSVGRREEGLLGLARAQRALGLDSDSAQNLAIAESILPSLDTQAAGRWRADLQFAQAEALVDSDPAAAARRAAEAISTFRSIDTLFRQAQLHLYRARALIKSGDPVAAELELVQGVEATSTEAARISRPDLRHAFRTRTWEVQNELIRLYTDLGRHDDAFAVREAAAQSMIGEAEALKQQLSYLPHDDAYVAFADLGDHYVAWFVEDGIVRVAPLTASPAQVTNALRRLTPALRLENSERTAEHLTWLYEALIAPLGSLQRVRRLVIAADGGLADVPFAALVNASGRYLIQDMEVVYTASLRAYLASRSAAALSNDSLDAAVLCDPRNPTLSLPALPGTLDEAKAVAATYQSVATWCGDSATQEALRQALSRARVVHFGGHAIANRVNPWSSRLVLAPSAGNPEGALLLSDIPTSALRAIAPVTRVLVLAACSTASGVHEGRRDAVSLTTAFNSLGIPWIVATMWDIEDAAALAAFREFHTALAASDVDAARALRVSQMALIDKRVPPARWAGIVAVAGGAASN